MEFESDNLKYCPLSQSDWPFFLSLFRDPAVIALCFDPLPDDVVLERFQSRLLPWDLNSDEWLCLLIKEKSSEQCVGVTGFKFDGKVAELGYLLHSNFHGQGYGTEQLASLLHWSKEQLGITQYQAAVTEGNIACEKILAKANFKLAERIPDAYEIGGKRYADLIYQNY
ncbi:N-acetyltransferase [Photobacterium sanctipauli]|uniref:N-acetyltransferase n=1 Tax=Photobacterium sanctipauli TaxID=1342794 RepID=A0A2T3P0T1_9GAMM|nr:GNAT family N-acetyltransferase [Photobacterium sanctipauli]PSW22078.1 N-acetyltransferase [Photobacterium sanctipauli]